MNDNSSENNNLPPYKVKYGKELASKVISLLKERTKMCYSHKEYCGVGLFYDGKGFHFSYVYEGYPERDSEPILYIEDETEIISFLSEQSDYTMCGVVKDSVFYEGENIRLNNQRITKNMMESFVRSKI